jgi:hypothetical protein
VLPLFYTFVYYSPFAIITPSLTNTLHPASKMENIKHSHVEVKGLKLHVAEIGTGIFNNLISETLLTDSFPQFNNILLSVYLCR